jgi:hypothetical protein
MGGGDAPCDRGTQSPWGQNGAKPVDQVHHRSTVTGRYLKPATAARHPRTTVTERG